MSAAPTPALAAYRAGRGPLMIGTRRDGRPIWLLAGGAPDDPPEPNKNDDPPEPDKGGYKAPETQADLDRIVGDRVARERAKYADYAELKAKADAHDKALEDAQTEQEKAVAAARKEGEQAASERANSRLITAEARAVAASAKFRNPSAAVKLADLSNVTVGDDGEVDATALKTALDALAESDPYLIDAGDGNVTPPPKPDLSQGGGSGGKNPGDAGRMAAERRFGKPA